VIICLKSKKTQKNKCVKNYVNRTNQKGLRHFAYISRQNVFFEKKSKNLFDRKCKNFIFFEKKHLLNIKYLLSLICNVEEGDRNSERCFKRLSCSKT
jgi:hypothetical protein